VAKVEALLSRVNAARERLAKVPAILKRFRQSVLAAACSGRLTEDWREENPGVEPSAVAIERTRELAGAIKTRRGVPEKVEVPSVVADLELPNTWALESTAVLLRSNVLFDVKDGNHGANHPRKGDFSDEGVPFITAAQVRDYDIDYAGAPKVAGEALDKLRVGFAECGDAILTHKGTVGRAALNTSACVLTPQTTYYRCNAAVLDAQWLVYFFTSLHFFRQCAAVMSQTTRDFVPIREQYRLFLAIPPLDEQGEIVRRLTALLGLADRIEQRLTTATTRTDRITQSILAKAFRGELVPTEAELARQEGRDYEPASVLLERIRAERAERDAGNAAPRKPRGKRTRKSKPAATPATRSSGTTDPPTSPARTRAKPTRGAETNTTTSQDDRAEAMATIREVLSRGGPRPRDEALRQIAQAQGHQRVGARIHKTLDHDLRTAVRRGIITNDRGTLSLLCRQIDEYEPDHLIDVLVTAIGRGAASQPDAIRTAARHLGYRRAGTKIKTAFMAAIRQALRRGLIQRDGNTLRKVR